MVVIAEQPGIDVAFAQLRLNGSKVHGQTSIVNKGREFGRIGRGSAIEVRSRLARELLRSSRRSARAGRGHKSIAAASWRAQLRSLPTTPFSVDEVPRRNDA